MGAVATDVPITPDQLHELFYVEEGVLHWKHRKDDSTGSRMFNSRYAGKPCGRPDGTGYLQTGITINGYTHRVANHRIILAMRTGKWPAPREIVDHADRDIENNSDDNIRLASRGQNRINSCVRTDNKSGFKGVSFHQKSGKWLAQSQSKDATGRRLTLLYELHHSPEEAASAYDAHISERYGEFALTNKALGLLI